MKFLLAILVGHGFVGWVWVVGWLSWFGSGLVIFFGIDFLVVVKSPLCCKRWNAPSCFMKICWFFCGCGFGLFFSLGFNFNWYWFSGLVGSESLGIFILGIGSWFLFLFGVGILVGKSACGLGFVLGFAGSIVPPATSVLGLVILAFSGMGLGVSSACVQPPSAFCSAWSRAPAWSLCSSCPVWLLWLLGGSARLSSWPSGCSAWSVFSSDVPIGWGVSNWLILCFNWTGTHLATALCIVRGCLVFWSVLWLELVFSCSVCSARPPCKSGWVCWLLPWQCTSSWLSVCPGVGLSSCPVCSAWSSHCSGCPTWSIFAPIASSNVRIQSVM